MKRCWLTIAHIYILMLCSFFFFSFVLISLSSSSTICSCSTLYTIILLHVPPHFAISKMLTFSLIIFLIASLIPLQPTGMLSPHHISSSAMIWWAPRRLCTEYVNTHTHMCTCISACVNAYQAFLSLPSPLAITVVLWPTRVTTKEWFRRGHKKNRVEILPQYCLYVCESACTYNYFLLVAFSDLWLKLEKTGE